MTMSNDPTKHGGSFIVRIWWERSPDDGSDGRWRGWIQHVRNGHQIYFANLRDLNAFIEGETGMPEFDERPTHGLG